MRLIVFAKAPVPGRVKTRLIPALGAEAAAQLARRLAQHALATAVAADFQCVELCCAPDADDPFFAECRRRFGLRLSAQGEGDLGARIERAFARGCPALLIGTDIPDLTAADLRAAAAALAAGNDAVFGPVADGGYGLVGLRAAQPALFADMPWSSAALMGATRARAAQLGLRWHELPPRHDIDRAEDVAWLQAQDWSDEILDRAGTVRG